ncbi:aldehyde dehydrogenase family protein [Mycoplasma sp. P36-A1]|uniref:aldehyde dehydrogenase family protein n=1 Tax=Mycoplasma sp. P36-A1 TaxID=3252900 RepID=UPI003C30A2C5
MYQEIIKKQKDYFNTNKTKDITHRYNMLRQMKLMLEENTELIYDAVYQDLNKDNYQTFTTELALLYKEIKHLQRNLSFYSKPRLKKPTLHLLPARNYTVNEPYGNTLIIAPWNYPILLSLQPSIASLAAGNTVLLKPSEIAKATENLLKQLIPKYFKPEDFSIVTGDSCFTDKLLNEKFDMIFFTGSSKVGQIVYEKASKHLCPVVLELGGKSPVIIAKDCNLDLTCKKIVEGKLINAGQTCIAPDYVLVDQSIKKDVINRLEYYANKYLINGIDDYSYPKIINDSHHKRLLDLLDNEILLNELVYNDTKISFTMVENPSHNSKIMQEEIFGPLLPIIEYTNIEEAIQYIKDKEKPLALYLFTKSIKIKKKIIKEISFGGGCINDVLLHITSESIPFGGVGNSGIGNYHNKYSFQTFSHEKGYISRPSTFSMPVYLMPQTKIKEKILNIYFKK